MPSPAALDAAAGRLDREAARLRVVFDDVARHTGANVWLGPAADAFADDLDGQRRHLDTAAETVESLARSLRAEADQLRAQAARESRERARHARTGSVPR